METIMRRRTASYYRTLLKRSLISVDNKLNDILESKPKRRYLTLSEASMLLEAKRDIKKVLRHMKENLPQFKGM